MLPINDETRAEQKKKHGFESVKISVVPTPESLHFEWGLRLWSLVLEGDLLLAHLSSSSAAND